MSDGTRYAVSTGRVVTLQDSYLTSNALRPEASYSSSENVKVDRSIARLTEDGKLTFVERGKGPFGSIVTWWRMPGKKERKEINEAVHASARNMANTTPVTPDGVEGRFFNAQEHKKLAAEYEKSVKDSFLKGGDPSRPKALTADDIYKVRTGWLTKLEEEKLSIWTDSPPTHVISDKTKEALMSYRGMSAPKRSLSVTPPANADHVGMTADQHDLHASAPMAPTSKMSEDDASNPAPGPNTGVRPNRLAAQRRARTEQREEDTSWDDFENEVLQDLDDTVLQANERNGGKGEPNGARGSGEPNLNQRAVKLVALEQHSVEAHDRKGKGKDDDEWNSIEGLLLKTPRQAQEGPHSGARENERDSGVFLPRAIEFVDAVFANGDNRMAEFTAALNASAQITNPNEKHGTLSWLRSKLPGGGKDGAHLDDPFSRAFVKILGDVGQSQKLLDPIAEVEINQKAYEEFLFPDGIKEGSSTSGTTLDLTRSSDLVSRAWQHLFMLAPRMVMATKGLQDIARSPDQNQIAKFQAASGTLLVLLSTSEQDVAFLASVLSDKRFLALVPESERKAFKAAGELYVQLSRAMNHPKGLYVQMKLAAQLGQTDPETMIDLIKSRFPRPRASGASAFNEGMATD